MKEIELWKDIKEYENNYQISNFGRIKSLTRILDKKGIGKGSGLVSRKGLLKKTSISNNGYERTNLWKDGKSKMFSIHRLVALHFIPNLLSLLEVNHIDGNKLNNHYSNLEWCTQSENAKHAFKLGLKVQKKGYKNKQSRKVGKYDLNNKLIEEYGSLGEASRITKIHVNKIWASCSSKYIWKYH